MASLPYPLCHDCQADIVGMARMPYPPTICNEILTVTLKKSNIYYLAIYIILFGHLIYITLPFILYYFFLVLVFFFEYVVFFFVVVVFLLDVVVTGL